MENKINLSIFKDIEVIPGIYADQKIMKPEINNRNWGTCDNRRGNTKSMWKLGQDTKNVPLIAKHLEIWFCFSEENTINCPTDRTNKIFKN